LIVKNAKIKLKQKPITISFEKEILSLDITFNDFRVAAPNIAGIDKNNENFDEDDLLCPKNLPIVITIPDLLTPGIKAKD
tara:strand:+ start:224 stop:463 length:240 start_codon:yes stop_codon:yes gene_type:complete